MHIEHTKNTHQEKEQAVFDFSFKCLGLNVTAVGNSKTAGARTTLTSKTAGAS